MIPCRFWSLDLDPKAPGADVVPHISQDAPGAPLSLQLGHRDLDQTAAGASVGPQLQESPPAVD
jgi:hypothetical protein